MLPALTAVLYLGAHGQSQPPIEASVFFNNDEYTLKVGLLDTTAAAWGSFADTLNTTGWGVLDIRTSGVYTDVVQHHAAGVLEGALTAAQIYPTYLNNNGFTFHGNDAPPKVVAFMAQQDAWTRAQIKGADPSDTFWSHVAALTAQFDGMVEGCVKRIRTAAAPLCGSPREQDKGGGRGHLKERRAGWPTCLSRSCLDSFLFFLMLTDSLSNIDGWRVACGRYGMMAAKSVVPALPVFAFQLLNGVGDLFQIIPAVDKTVGDISVLSSPLSPSSCSCSWSKPPRSWKR